MNQINLDEVKYNNYLLNQSEIKDKKIILKSKPLSLIFTITDECQLNCIMCPVKKSRFKNIGLSQIKEIIEFCGKEAVTVQWMGGEPLLHSEFEELITLANDVNLLQTVTTNGLLLNGIIAEKLIKYNADIVISVDGSNKKIYESIRKGADFDLLVKNIQHVNMLREKYNHTGHFGINFCVLKQNSQDIIDMVEFAKNYNFRGINFISPYDVEEKYLLVNNEELKENFLKAGEKAKSYKIEFIGWSPFAGDMRQKDFNNAEIQMLCYSPFYNFGINPDGRMDICICRDLSFTDKNKIKDLNEIWNAQQVQKYRQNIYNNELPSEICGQCPGIGLRHYYHPQVIERLNSIKNIH